MIVSHRIDTVIVRGVAVGEGVIHRHRACVSVNICHRLMYDILYIQVDHIKTQVVIS